MVRNGSQGVSRQQVGLPAAQISSSNASWAELGAAGSLTKRRTAAFQPLLGGAGRARTRDLRYRNAHTAFRGLRPAQSADITSRTGPSTNGARRLLLTLSARCGDNHWPALRRPIGPLHSAGTGNATHMLSCIDGLIRSESERPTKSWPASGVRVPVTGWHADYRRILLRDNRTRGTSSGMATRQIRSVPGRTNAIAAYDLRGLPAEAMSHHSNELSDRCLRASGRGCSRRDSDDAQGVIGFGVSFCGGVRCSGAYSFGGGDVSLHRC